jgi:exonuclease SbcC
MKILSLRMENVRSHKESFIEFSDKITVVWGKTGSGKSTILMAIYYALFGSSDLSNAEIMRRGAKKMVIELKILQSGNEYEIVRGLKRVNDSIIIDSDNLKVLKNGVQLNALNRANDINSLVYEMLGFGKDSKASQMFQVLSYTKQDNIRNLIEMRKEERQEFIDRILQLSKYKDVFEKLKPLIDYYSSKYEVVMQAKEFIKSLGESIDSLNKKMDDNSNKIVDNEKKLEVLAPSIDKKRADMAALESNLKKLRIEYEKHLAQKSRRVFLEKSIEKNYSEIKSLEDKASKLKPLLLELPETFEGLMAKLHENSSKIKVIEHEMIRLKKESETIDGLDAKCPTCFQEINGAHKKEIIQKNDDKIKILADELKMLAADSKSLEDKMDIAKKNDLLSKELDSMILGIGLLESQRHAQEEELSNMPKAESFDVSEKIDNLECGKKSLYEKLGDLLSKKSAIESANNELKYLQKSFERELTEKRNALDEQSKKVADERHYKLCIEFLNKLRANVKDIRQIIRSKFLNDFKNSFAKKFDEIRNNDEEYYVEINGNYEPVAYSSTGEEVPIGHLSGGEKTSAALAYRLALSDLAGEMNNLSPPELLILDEPTSGFDSDDVKALPQALENISSIPQIIIVTHEALLKEIAENIIDVEKKLGVSKISYL